MRNPHNRSFGGDLCSILLVSVCCAGLIMLLSSCSGIRPVQQTAQHVNENMPVVQYSLVCVIHGDGDYLYHDTIGNEYKADEEALAEVKRIAQQNPQAEVFIFHHKPRRHFLFFFPRRDGEFSYYRNGQLIAHKLYWRNQEQSYFDTEVGLYRSFHVNNQLETMRVFLYCGHEIPETGGMGYDASYPDRPFTVQDFANGLKEFARDSARFDLMILSTCFGGTPYTIGSFGLFARFIIASPVNLHLSYFDLHSLERLDFSLRDGDVPAFAKRFAHQAFDRLTKDVQTEVGVAVYDVDRVQEYLRSVHMVYDDTLTTLKGRTQASKATIEHCDCADLSKYMLPKMNEGVNVFYRPARFGRLKHKQNHSGWECWKEREPRAATSHATEPVLK